MEKESTSNHADRVSHNLHRSRAQEYLNAQVLGVSAAMGAVWLGRNAIPKSMHQLDKTLEKQLAPMMKGESQAYIADYARRTLNYTTMLASGLITSVSSQVLQARNRRDGKDHAGDISLSRDVTRVLTGWSIGAFGAVAALNLAERFGRRASAKSVTDILDRAEELLDKNIFHGATYDTENKVSEGLIANAVMIAGAAPATVAAQALYDNVRSHPAYERG